jgi:hypothetical protein
MRDAALPAAAGTSVCALSSPSGRPDNSVQAVGRGEQITEADLYEDVRPGLAALRAAGVRVVIAGNQTARTGRSLRALDLPADTVATSGEWGVAKPQPEFFGRLVDVAHADPHQVLYVGDHPQNDVFPAAAAGKCRSPQHPGTCSRPAGDASCPRSDGACATAPARSCSGAVTLSRSYGLACRP